MCEINYLEISYIEGENLTRIDRMGNVFYYKGPHLHREDGPAIEWCDGSEWWSIDGKKHRTDGPAIIWNGSVKEWWVNGIQHRANNPAVEYATGQVEWWLDGKCISHKYKPKDFWNLTYGKK